MDSEKVFVKKRRSFGHKSIALLHLYAQTFVYQSASEKFYPAGTKKRFFQGQISLYWIKLP